MLEVERDGVLKRVVQYATDEPRDFWTVATLIDGIASLIEWIPEGPPGGKLNAEQILE